MSGAPELEQYKAWLKTLHVRYQEVVAEREMLRVAAEAVLKPWEASDGLDPRWPDTRVQLAHAMGVLRGVLAKVSP